MGKKTTFVVLFVFVVLSLNLISATMTAGRGNHSIGTTYGPKANVTGWINFSLVDEAANSNFVEGNRNIKLIDLLRKNTGAVYTCNPVTCESSYTSSNGQTSKNFALANGANGLYGLKFVGNPVTINSVSFSVQSDAPASCLNQIKIDILDDGIIDFVNNKSSDQSCTGKTYGCFSSTNQGIVEYSIGTDKNAYCQKINLTESPSFIAGAWIKNVSGSLAFNMEIYDSNGFGRGSCTLPTVSSNTGEEVSCVINYTATQAGEHYVCVYSLPGVGEYRLRGYLTAQDGCGAPGINTPIQNTPAAYQIFAQPRQYASPGTLNIPNEISSEKTLAEMMQGYVANTFGGTDCSNGCNVPIRIYAGVNQNVVLNNLAASYQNQGGSTIENRFYALTENPAKINKGFGLIDLDDAGFALPNSIGNYTFVLKFNSGNFFTERLSIKNVPQIVSILPRNVAAAFPTDFGVRINSSSNVTSYFWDFGDNSTKTTQENKTSHTYSSVGTYNLTVTITDYRQLTDTKSFEINVTSPRSLIEYSLASARDNLARIESQLAGFDAATRQNLNDSLNLSSVRSEINRLQTAYNLASLDQDYSPIVADLLKISLPNAIIEGRRADKLSFLPDLEIINPEFVSEISNGTYDFDKASDYAYSIVAWNQQNLDTKISFSEISGNYNTGIQPVMNTFKIEITEKVPVSGSYFLIVPRLEGLTFASGTNVRETEDFFYIDMTNKKEVSFYTKADVDFTNIPAFISPGLSSLTIVDVKPELREQKWFILVLSIGLLLLVALIVYVILQEWYKRKYESYLFRNRNDLYNMVTYLNNAKKKGLKNHEIAENLKKAKWNSEQVSYVMKKYAGRRTGMIELPFFNFSKEEK